MKTTLSLILSLIVTICTSCGETIGPNCDQIYTNAGLLIQCSRDVNSAAWAEEAPYLLNELEYYLPGVSGKAVDFTIVVESVAVDAKFAGQYMGYHGINEIRIYIRPQEKEEMRHSSIVHEWAHMWEDRVKGITYAEWSSSETHFVNYQQISTAISEITGRDAEDPSEDTCEELKIAEQQEEISKTYARYDFYKIFRHTDVPTK